MPLYLAIDAGGTKTTCLLADDHRILARATTGSIKLMRVAEHEASARLAAMLEFVARAAGVSLGDVTHTCFGLASCSIPAVRAWAHQAIAATVAGDLILCGDEHIALDAAFAGGPGILVIAGTGSNIVGRNADGSTHSAGGWGPVLGDEGAGFWIGLEALRAGLRNLDRLGFGASPSTLLEAIQQHWHLASLGELIALGNQRTDREQPVPDFATLAPVVARCAAQGDALAASILARAGQDLAAQVVLVHRKMLAAGYPAAAPVGVAFTGSVLTHIAPVHASMTAHLANTLPAAHVQTSPADPLEGALWRARRG